MTGRARAIAAGAVLATGLAACGGSAQPGTGRSSARAAPSSSSAQSPPAAGPAPRRFSPGVTLPPSSHGATSCTVYENNDGTQIVVDSPTLNVRAQCLIWSANLPGVGYLWGYERAAALPAGTRLCSLSDRRGMLRATVVDAASLVPGSSAERARALGICARIIASGWTRVGRRVISRARAVRS